MGKPVTSHSAESLIEASDNGGFSYGEKYSVDTASVAVLALTCVKRSIKAPDRMVLRLKILNALKCLIKNILQETTSDGLIGNLYSTGLAMQVRERRERERREGEREEKDRREGRERGERRKRRERAEEKEKREERRKKRGERGERGQRRKRREEREGRVERGERRERREERSHMSWWRCRSCLC
ncbi:transcobalamin-1-like [Huso huso]|uniref:Transcobalamin-1-like n=1 Tax=Huso huso TaxID=61971 RepID=A0ABR0YZE3_HUSHU